MNRFTEPSTWAGLAAILQMASTFVPPQYAWVVHALTAATGAAAVSMREAGNGA